MFAWRADKSRLPAAATQPRRDNWHHARGNKGLRIPKQDATRGSKRTGEAIELQNGRRGLGALDLPNGVAMQITELLLSEAERFAP